MTTFCLVHYDGAAFTEIGNFFGGQIEDSAGCSHNNVDGVVETHDIVLEGRSTGSDHALDAQMLSDLFDNGGCLECKFASRNQNENYNGNGNSKNCRVREKSVHVATRF